MTNVWPLQKDAVTYYGNPSVNNERWKAINLVKVQPPFKLFYEGKPVASVSIHRKCGASLDVIFKALWQYYNKDERAIATAGVSIYDGTYAYRPMRSLSNLSMHAFGCAIDFNAALNGQTFNRNAGLFKANSPIVTMFKAEGWIWGGDWSGKRDPMHFQAARTK